MFLVDGELTGEGYRALSEVTELVCVSVECGFRKHKQFVQTDQNCIVKVYTFHPIFRNTENKLLFFSRDTRVGSYPSTGLSFPSTLCSCSFTFEIQLQAHPVQLFFLNDQLFLTTQPRGPWNSSEDVVFNLISSTVFVQTALWDLPNTFSSEMLWLRDS